MINEHQPTVEQAKATSAALPPIDIELTPEWQQLLFEHCFDNGEQLHFAESHNSRYAYLRYQNSYGVRVHAALQNYFVTLSLPSHDVSSKAHDEILDQMLSGNWHMAHIALADPNEPFLHSICHYLKRQQFPYLVSQQFCNWQLHVDFSSETYLTTLPSKLRNTIKRKFAKLEKQAEHYEYKLIRTPQDVVDHFDDYEQIYTRSWKPEEERIGFIKAFLPVAASNDWLRMGMLYINNKPAAAQIWFVYHGKANIFKLAYDPDFQQFSPGSLITKWLMQHVIDEDKVSLVDFGMGDESYKSDWMNVENSRHTVTVFNNRRFFGKLARLRYYLLPRVLKRLLNR